MMSTAEAPPTSFHDDLTALLPRMRIHALSLTHDRDQADDLVQETVVKVLAAEHSYRPGCFAAWVFRIQRNEFISRLRRSRPAVPLDEASGALLSLPAQQDSGLVMGEFLAAFGQLAPAQREALVLSVVDGQSYDAIARAAGVSVGTVKSRVSRGRRALERLLMGEPPTDEPGFDAAGDRRHPNPARRRQGAGGYGAAEKVFDAEPS